MSVRARTRYGILLAGMLLLGSLLAVVATSRGDTEPVVVDSLKRATAGQPGSADGALRTVVVYTDPADALPSGRDQFLIGGQLEHGRMPVGESIATVLTDEDCEPDSQGVSHCLNRIALDDGSELAVRHSHIMQEVPCLFPGEEIFLRPV